eukprot:CAMPEP_0185259566 /NCGR_PEP_ID=MMETSP1359-20130426/8320_1 /TAXON_ID=552665 /ORGANISM="Bigelowiella longifila, Strain CCMP242" /LENGTH=405 /DNA_ID=CAMNT_0027845515 /DNA_START=28 /DNA_END=1246 /DNA_ORIENTATION=+
MRMIESAGYVAAMRHLHSQKDSSGSHPSCRVAVTHRLEHMDFLKPIYIGNLAKLQANVIFVKNASLLVEVIVKAEDLTKASESLCNKAYVWYLSMEKSKEGEDEEKTKLRFPKGENWRKSASTPGLPKSSTHNDKFSQMYAKMYAEREKLKQQVGHGLDDLKSANAMEDEKAETVSEEGGGKKEKEAPCGEGNGKSPDVSASTLTQVMLPSDCGEFHIVYGGTLMKLMDNASGMVAVRHCRSNVVTACVDALDFISPVALGTVVCVNAKATFASSRSLEVVVTVTAETFGQDTAKICVQGTYTFVSLGKDGRVQALPAISPGTTQEKKAYAEGQKRYLKRRELRKSRENESPDVPLNIQYQQQRNMVSDLANPMKDKDAARVVSYIVITQHSTSWLKLEVVRIIA